MFFKRKTPVSLGELYDAKEAAVRAGNYELKFYGNSTPKSPQQEVDFQIAKRKAQNLSRNTSNDYEKLWQRYQKENRL